MPIHHKIEAILQCPITKLPLFFMGRDDLEHLNTGIRSKQFQHLNGMEVKIISLDAALFSSDRVYIYPVIEGILVLLPSLAMVRKEDNDASRQCHIPAETESVMRFYDEIGWREVNMDLYEDAKRFEDLRPVSAKYIHNCHLRLRRYIPEHGTYLLDAASGPIQYSEYLTYSNGYDHRICVDISFEALKIAKRKLGDKGIFLQCDVICLPLKDYSIDSFVSLHTIYHVPRSKQLTAFLELYRVLKRDSRGAVVYSWGKNSLLMELFMSRLSIVGLGKMILRSTIPSFLYDALKKLKMYFLQTIGSSACTSSGKKSTTLTPQLYFYTWGYSWFRRELASQCGCEISSWRSVSVPFLKKYVHKNLFGRQFLDILFRLENAFPNFFGKYGQYPIITFRKTDPIAASSQRGKPYG